MSYKDSQRLFSKETFLAYPTLTYFTQRKRKTRDANGLLVLSLISIIVYIYSLGKKFYCTYLKTTWHKMIFSYAKPVKRENAGTTFKNMKKNKK